MTRSDQLVKNKSLTCVKKSQTSEKRHKNVNLDDKKLKASEKEVTNL